MPNSHIHQGQPVLLRGELPENATAAMVMIHGRGGGAMSIVALLSHLTVGGFTYLAPEAAGSVWYPQRFLAPRASNEPFLTSTLTTVHGLVQQLQAAGIPATKTMLLGFSQGACVALEYAARHPQRYGGVVALSGGLIGADDELTGYTGSLEGTPIFIGCSDVDSHIPEARVHTSAALLTAQSAQVTTRIYPNMGHTVNEDEIAFVREMMLQMK
jgi:predicted esterase